VLRAAAAIVAPLALLAGCVRSLRAEPVEGGGPADTGLPLAFALDGAGPEVAWDFGDGAPGSSGARASHAFARAGRYQVQARQGGRVVASTFVDVRARPVLRAIPEEAQGALSCPAPGTGLDAAADLLDGMLGPGGAAELLNRTGVVHLALQSAAAGEGAVDPDEGLAFFTLAGVSGVVAAVGITDGEAASLVLGQFLEEQGAALSQSPDGFVRVHWPGRPDAAAFVDRGYLYLALPERGPEVDDQLRRAMAAVTAGGARGAERWPLIAELGAAVPEGICAVAIPRRPGAGPRGFFGTLRVERRELLVEGVFRADGPLWGVPAAAPALLDRGPEGPVMALSVSAPAEALAALLWGPRGAPERTRSAEALQGDGWDIEEAVEAAGDEVAVLAYFDAPAFLGNLIRGSREPDPRGALRVDARLRRKDPALRAVREALEAKGVEYAQRQEQGREVLRFRALEHPVEVIVGPERLRLRAGTVAGWRREVPLREALADRVGPGAFGAGHVSAVLDLDRLRDELRAPASVPGVADQRVEDVQRFALRFIDQLTGASELALDLAPDPLGARLRARVAVGAKGQ
jgi:hypothetical protein